MYINTSTRVRNIQIAIDNFFTIFHNNNALNVPLYILTYYYDIKLLFSTLITSDRANESLHYITYTRIRTVLHWLSPTHIHRQCLGLYMVCTCVIYDCAYRYRIP